MKAFFFIPILIFILFTTSCRQAGSNLNLDFERIENGMPESYLYEQRTGYSVCLDSVNVKSGKYAIAIESAGRNYDRGQGIYLELPHNYEGERITLSGYIKTENATGGFAGLWMRIEPGIELNEMHEKRVTGTTDWEKHEITLDLSPAQTSKILVGGYLYGKGKMWLDDLKITIDGKDIERAKPYQPKPFPADNDREFGMHSNIIFPELTEQKIEDLELLGRIWGFMKYHHPAIGKGNYNWDYELFRILPEYLKVTDRQQRDKMLIKWINRYGKISKCRDCRPTSGNAFLKPDLSWIAESDISLKLKNLLHRVYTGRNQGFHYYIRMYPDVGNPIFMNERTYDVPGTPDAGFRLLALYRYWNMIHYFSPYRYLTDKDWNAVLKEYVPSFIKAGNRLKYESAVALLIGEVCDSHAFLLDFERIGPLSSTGEIPAQVRFVEDKLVVVDCYDEDDRESELKRGDIITHIEGRPVEAIVDSMKRYYSASNEARKMRNITGDILRSEKDYIHIDYISSGKKKQERIYTERIGALVYYLNRKKHTDKCYGLIGEDIGYINLETIKEKDIPVIRKEFMHLKGIIIDIRNYPPAFVIQALGSYFVSHATPFLKFTKGDKNNPGEFNFSPSLFEKIYNTGESYQGMLAVIVNENTLSRAEYTAMAFQAGDNTTTVGSTTAGAVGKNPEIVLPGGLRTTITGIGIYYPDGRETQRVGIVPDIEVKPTIQGIREGRDELLEKAVEIIRNK